MFKPVSSKVNFPQLEEEILRFWKEKGIFEKSVEQRKGGPRFVFYEGPPFANGNPGIHHVLARVFKDVVVRYRASKGYYVPRIAGWDTHGLPVELEIEKQLGFSSKKQIEEYGVAEFNKRCRESVFRYLKEWNSLTERIAYWVDLEKAYMTMSNDYIESVWWAIKQMWDKGLVYQGYRVTPHCPRCGTSLSSHEVALGYQDDVPDPSVYVKFRLVQSTGHGDEADQRLLNLLTSTDTYLLAWTTTPWTLPGNTALAVAPDAQYVVVRELHEYLILSEALLKNAGLDNKDIIARFKGSDIAGAEYEPLYDPHNFGVSRLSMPVFVAQEKPEADPLTKRGLTYKVIKGKILDNVFVTLEEGTGIVHIAPAFGEVDFDAGNYYDLSFVQPVDLQGKVIGTYPGAGKFVKEADPFIIEDLKRHKMEDGNTHNLVFRSETIKHTYPFCWRCSTPLLYYAKETWYIRTTAVKDRLIAGNEEINWYPEHIKHGRFGDWLENNVDWAFSRERYWGTPLPVWRCESCGAHECVGGVGELRSKPEFSGLKDPLDLHRPFVDDVGFACGKCGGKMRRTPEVLDCWFDSGSMPFAQLHYPFDNKELFDRETKQADFICEAVDQTRGWFYSLHAISTLLFERPSFKNVICLGLILDAKGEKMSKTRGNVVDPWMIINKHGADALRWYLFTASPPGNARRFDEKSVAEITRQLFLTLWNVYSFFVTYANIDRFTPGAAQPTGEPPELDRWITSELNQLILDVDAAMSGYDPTEAGRKIEGFVDELSNWYVRRSRRRFWKSENDADKLSAYNALYQCLVTLTKLLAPLAPYLAEELYQNLVCSVFTDAPESVHLTDFPLADRNKIDQQLTDDVRLAMKISSLGRAARSKAGIKVRQPLPVNYVGFSSINERTESSLRRIMPQILDELNIKDLKWNTLEDVAAREREGFVVVSEATCNVAAPPPSSISVELQAEGMAREIVHRLQTMRRSAGFDIADHILTFYHGDDYVRKVLWDFASYVKQETLSTELVDGIPAPDVFTERFKLEGHEITLGVKRTG
ncbi:MAG: isoleucine--tRNA ligase [Chloroflexi bacterium]|nr:isoleucine--tRNA ligase [Chloroflexota bacterium]